ncbi:MAG: hypothetical protein A2288_00430 [Candidatus Moranbacteria bacterium RIFOXYA12_FULL_44_15]|nr:MAG: hypothetical protein A2288_00430 [Candidatus Moranbacteria bacterium RIFOXYA12_FULL_44_15]OGI34762.1 MAG: hypothetical protein A2259_05320 [Candidatus Moranbacteria bacterium RIFOXYA2_FULL_43_15]
MTKTKTTILLIFILAVGLFLRAYNIDNVPPGIYADEAENGIDAMTANASGQYQWFYPGNQGREGLFMNLIALCFKLFGVSAFTLKLPSIIFGTLAIGGIYLLAKELFSNSRIGFISAFLTAVSFWAINFSRISFRANMVPAILSFSFYFLWKGLRTKRWHNFAIGGFIFGIGLHTYISFRIAPLILIAMFFALIITRENFLKKYWTSILVFIAFASLSAGPMFYTFFVAHPEYWESRTGHISILNPEINQGHLFKTFLKTFGLSLAKYNFWGDQNWRHNFPPYALLDPLTGIAFLFGFIYSLLKTFHLFVLRFGKKVRDQKLEVYVFLTVWFFVMLIPEVMGYEGNPHSLRAIGTLPVVFIFAALAFNYILGKTEDKTLLYKKTVFGLIILMFIFIGLFNSVKYHLVWAKKIETAKAFDRHLREISGYFNGLPRSTEKYLVADEYPSRPVKVETSKTENVFYVWPVHIEHIKPKTDDFIIIMTDPAEPYLQKLKQMFPGINTYTHDKPGGGYFLELKMK